MDDLGRELFEIRTAKGLSLKDISELTRIDVKFLAKLEKNEFDFMPQLYIKAFVKEYALALGLDEKSYLDRLNQILNPQTKKVLSESKSTSEEITKQGPIISTEKVDEGVKPKIPILSNKLKSALYIILILLLFLILIFLPSIKNIGTDSDQRTTDSATTEISKQDAAKISLSEVSQATKSDSLVLSATSTDKVWIQVKCDSKITEEVLLLTGVKRTWYAKNDFELIVGSVGALNLKLNGKDIPLAGGLGAVRKIKISPNKIEVLKTLTPKN